MEQPAETPRRGWRLAGAQAVRYRGVLSWLAVTSLLGALIEAAFLVLLTSILLSVANHGEDIELLGRHLTLVWAIVVGVIAISVRLLLNLIAARTSARFGMRVTRDQRRRLAESYLNASWDLQQSQPSGRLQDLVTSFVNRVNAAMISVAQGLTAILSLLAFLSTGVIVSLPATAGILVALVGLAFALSPIRRVVRSRAEVSTASSLAFASRVAEFGTLGLEMQTFGVASDVGQEISSLTQFTTEAFRRMQVLNNALSPIYTFAAYAAILGGTAFVVSLGTENLSIVGSVMLLMLRSLSYGQQLMTVVGNIASSIPSLEGVEDAVHHYQTNQADQGSTVPTATVPLTFDAVSFQYSTGTSALADVSITIAPGEMLGVIGPSGAGKSTFAQLLLGLRQPTHGRVLVSGVDLRTVDRAWWTRRTAFVAQQPLLFTGTLAENLRFWRSGIPDQDLMTALEQAHLSTDISQLAGGLEAHLGQRGGALSGGQQQRVSLARALAGHPQLLVLDEPTSALDSRTEAFIRDSLARLKGRITVVIIAHRISTLDMCDRILVIQGGRVAAFDTPDALLATNDFYRAAMASAKGT